MLIIVPVILDQAVGDCSHYFRSGCWLLFPFFLSVCWSLFLLFWIRLLATVSIFFISLLVIVPIILDQVVDYCSSDFGSGC